MVQLLIQSAHLCSHTISGFILWKCPANVWWHYIVNHLLLAGHIHKMIPTIFLTILTRENDKWLQLAKHTYSHCNDASMNKYHSNSKVSNNSLDNWWDIQANVNISPISLLCKVNIKLFYLNSSSLDKMATISQTIFSDAFSWMLSL